jgi:hypothetical protein
MEDSPGLSAEQQRLCIEITRKLRQSPAANVFNEPVDPKKQNIPNYFKKIRNPQDLGTIYQRLQAGEYNTITQWERDVNTVWSNAETFNGKDSLIGSLAQHMARRFQRLKKPLDRRSVSGWTKHVYTLRSKFDRLLGGSPQSLQTIIPRSFESAHPMVIPFSTREMCDFILDEAEHVFEEKDIDQIFGLLQKEQFPMRMSGGTLVVDVNNLSAQTLCEIRLYLEKKQMSEKLSGHGVGDEGN